MKKELGFIGAALLMAAPAMAADTTTYNCDFQPSCEVAPGIYGAMASPAKSKFDLSIGGFVKLDYVYNSVNLGANGFLLPGAPGGGIPAMGTTAQHQDQSEFTARQSRFWLKVAGPTFIGAKTGALIEADFAGTSTTTNNNVNENGFVRMRHAYGTLDWANTQVLFGQTSDIFGPAVASTVDFRQAATLGVPNNPRVAQVRLTQKVPLGDTNSLKLVLGVQNPVEDVTTASASGTVVNTAGQVMFISKALGTAPGFYGMAMNNLTVGAFGLYGSQKVVSTKAVDVYGYGVYAFVPVLKSSDGKNRAMTMSLETQAYISAGMNWNGANASTATGAATATASATADSLLGSKTAAKGFGLYGQVIFYPTQDLGITGGYSRRNALNYASYTGITFEKYNELYYANIAYDLNAAVRVATEYEHVKTQYSAPTGTAFAGDTVRDFGQANIIRVAAYYFF